MNILPSRLFLLPNIRAGLASALGRFPWMLLCGLAGTMAAIVGGENVRNNDLGSLCAKVGMTAALGMPLFFSLRMLRERVRRMVRLPVEIVGLPLLAGWFLMLPHRVFDGPEIVAIRWMLLLAALHLSAAVSGYTQGPSGNGFWQFNRRLFLRFCLATLYAGVLTAGLELALLSADKLFELKLEKSYAYLFFIVAGCFHPVFFLSGVPRDFAALELDTEHPRGLKAFTQFALAPLVAVYTAILYAYALKILTARAWPHGWVALPVLILSGIGILSALLLYPLRMRPEETWARWFSRNFPRALAPLSLFLLLSVRERIAAYGVTEERYLGIIAGGWILAWTMVFTFRKTAGIRWVPASLAVICLLAAFGPWSAGSISKGSQLRRLTRLLEAHGLMAGDKIRVPESSMTLSSENYEEIRSTIRYLVGMHGVQAIRGLFGGSFKEMDWTNLSRGKADGEILTRLNLVRGQGGGNTYASYSIDQNSDISVEGFKRVSVIQSLFGVTSNGVKKRCNDLFIGIENGTLETADSANASSQKVPLETFFKSLPTESQSAMQPERMTADWKQNGHTYRILFMQISVTRKSGEPARISSCSFLLLEK